MKPILFVVGSPASYRIHKRFAEFCVRHGRTVTFVYDREPDSFFDEISADATALGQSAIALDSLIASRATPECDATSTTTSWRARVFASIRRRDTSQRMAAFSRIILSRIAAATTLLNELKPGVMVVAEDGVSGPLALIKAAQSSHVPVAVLPYGYGTQRDFEIALEAKSRRGEIERPTGRNGAAIKLLAREWIKRGEFAGVLLFPSDYIVVLESAGIRVNNAWIVHGGTADRLLVESPVMLELYRSEGVPASKLVLTGSPYGDFVLEALAEDGAARKAFRQPRTIDPAETRLLVSWPPSYHDQRGERSEFATYTEMTQAILGGLRRLPDMRVTVSIHPAVPADQRDAIVASGVEVSDEYVLRLIPRHDIYVSYYSSTIRWAIACGKPVLNYDAYQLALDVYDQAPGVITTASSAALLDQAATLASSDEAFRRMAQAQIDVAPRWGLLDEPAMPRLLAELDHLTSRRL